MSFVTGIDPGVTATGIAIFEVDSFERYDLVYIHTIKRVIDWWHTAKRVANKLEELAFKYRATVCIEEPVMYHRVMGNRPIIQGMFVGALISCINSSCAINDKPNRIYLVSPTTAKLALTGKGKSSKPEMVAAAREKFDNVRWADFKIMREKEAMADATAIALAHIKKLNGVRRLI